MNRIRTCIVCGSKSDKFSLVRIVRSGDGTIEFDATGRLAGRGAYVCSEACFEKACSGNRLSAALKYSVTNADKQRLLQQATSVFDNARVG